ncbi:MAG: HAMP domain-containing histidine kinase, partial [Anaerolineae bacterium]|nr:HAMP domain-containing histidine kinase [Anaerolineae bacterium]
VDSGEGIAADQVTHIFEPFYKVDGARTPSRAGLGLGLTIVKMVVDAHEGQIEVESMPGKGSTFRVRLPLAFADAPTPLGTVRV